MNIIQDAIETFKSRGIQDREQIRQILIFAKDGFTFHQFLNEICESNDFTKEEFFEFESGEGMEETYLMLKEEMEGKYCSECVHWIISDATTFECCPRCAKVNLTDYKPTKDIFAEQIKRAPKFRVTSIEQAEYAIILSDPDGDSVTIEARVIAKSEEEAIQKWKQYELSQEDGLNEWDLEHFDRMDAVSATKLCDILLIA